MPTVRARMEKPNESTEAGLLSSGDELEEAIGAKADPSPLKPASNRAESPTIRSTDPAEGGS